MKEIITDILKSEEGKKAAIRISYVIGAAVAYRITTSDTVKLTAGKFKAEFKKRSRDGIQR